MSLKTQLRGTGVALVTPFKKDLSVDFDALGKVIDAMIAGGVEYLITLGTTGETPTLEKQEKKDIVNYTFEKVAGRVPVVVGVGGNNTAELIKDLSYFPLEKATAVLSAAPYYNKPSQEGIFQHYKTVAEASPKPVILYNVPGRTGRNMSAATTIRLAHEVANIAGMKEASGDMVQCMEILRDVPQDFLVVSGDDALAMAQIACGMDGVISVAANAFPKQFSDMVRAALNSDMATAKKLNDPLLKAYDLMFAENNPSGVKAFMYEQGLIQNEVRLPVVPLSSRLHDAVKKYLGK
ncbi:MAG: 4-hydroxy-tetrahydrodipicolinate synthase [Sediminibacterium sp. Gen4]|uniref:4-hydroxy-tetrahydrodipicolinate synthase n=1 Tax=unclassified Sediminibacterium TaxID=2635961 RepID=UPI0015B95BBB|nr:MULTISPECIES: 4-hydroxy-tetrahydrodipicolinate synthase [unclassified Sediminibacterium]MBW0162074.1 4-hydroxy-tetrahydrodipicolinate synthase [Sediminibacterium sp.]MBW0165734.1 4-hydroxy-tetrahydrodipicolinate synthase [Sediminibacterium sp.]NWK64701.1 4-hydroxy-tetrahydrodipicolinate synthase [Sediminibacterium sp. Gen4]